MRHAGARTAGLAAGAGALATPGRELESELTGATPWRRSGRRQHLDSAYIIRHPQKRKSVRELTGPGCPCVHRSKDVRACTGPRMCPCVHRSKDVRACRGPGCPRSHRSRMSALAEVQDVRARRGPGCPRSQRSRMSALAEVQDVRARRGPGCPRLQRSRLSALAEVQAVRACRGPGCPRSQRSRLSALAEVQAVRACTISSGVARGCRVARRARRRRPIVPSPARLSLGSSCGRTPSGADPDAAWRGAAREFRAGSSTRCLHRPARHVPAGPGRSGAGERDPAVAGVVALELRGQRDVEVGRRDWSSAISET
jgi:hypothetical protein